MSPDFIHQTDNPNTVPPASEEHWQQARGQLLGFAAYLARNNSGVTAAQLRMAVARADLFAKLLASCEELVGDVDAYLARGHSLTEREKEHVERMRAVATECKAKPVTHLPAE